MCPSFMVTREEKHSTRGRARLLFEMMSGHLRDGGWRDRHVKEALDLCLSCKGCKGDCPVSVDMATYKAEFLAHYYARRIRPRQAYALGLIPVWTRLASHAPGLANAARPRRCSVRWPNTSPASNHAARRPRWPPRPSVTGSPGTKARPRGRKSCCGRTPSPTTSRRRSGSPRSASWKRLAAGCGYRVGSLCCGRPLLRLRDAAHGQALAAAHPGRAPRPDRSRPARDRPGAELPGCLPGRTRQSASRRHRRDPAGRAERHARRVPGSPRLRAAAAWNAVRWCRCTATTARSLATTGRRNFSGGWG